jgi:DNA-binding MarR family transcriptional regulator
LYITTMIAKPEKLQRDIFQLVKDLGKVLRSFQNESVLCEGVTFNQFCILDYVAEKGDLELSELHRLLSVEKSTTTRLIDPLVRRGLLNRRKSHHDSRAVELTLTGDGREVHQAVWECISGFIDNVLRDIPGEKRKDIMDALKLFISSINHSCGNDCC